MTHSFGPYGSAPYGSAAFGVTAAPDPTHANLFDSVAISGLLLDYLNGKVPLSAADSAAFTDATSEERLFNLRDTLSTATVVTSQATLYPVLGDSMALVDVVRLAWSMLLSDSATITDASGLRLGLAIADALQATAIANGKLTAYAAVASAIALEDATKSGWSVTASDTAAFTDAVQNVLRAMLALDDTAALSDTATGSLRLSLVCPDGVTLADTLAANLRLNASIADEVLLYASFRLGGTEYQGWAVNTDLRAATEHRNQPFDSIVAHPKGVHYAAGPGGIVQFTGTDDDGEPIDAWLKTFLTDFGSHQFKRAPDVWLGLTTEGRMLVKTLTRDPRTGVQYEDWYEAITKQDMGEAQGRAKIGRGLKSTWWGMELRNIQGSDFRLDEIGWRPIVLDKRQ